MLTPEDESYFEGMFRYRQGQAEGSLAAKVAQENGHLSISLTSSQEISPETNQQIDDRTYWILQRPRLKEIAQRGRRRTKRNGG